MDAACSTVFPHLHGSGCGNFFPSDHRLDSSHHSSHNHRHYSAGRPAGAAQPRRLSPILSRRKLVTRLVYLRKVLWYKVKRTFRIFPWYVNKTTPGFADALRALRKVLWRQRIIMMFGNNAVHDKKYQFLLEALAPAA